MRIFLVLPFTALALLATLQVGIHEGRRLEAMPWPQDLPVMASSCYSSDWGEYVYLTRPDTIIRAIYVAEGAVPSYGVIYLAKQFGSHENVPRMLGRAAAARALHTTYREWRGQRAQGPFLKFLRDRYAPIGALNDPRNLNANWLTNVALNIAAQLAGDDL